MSSQNLSTARFPYLARRTVAEVTVLLAIPVFLVLLHFGIPETTRAEYHFYFQDPSLHSIWTSAYLHSSVDHLSGNLQTYLLLVAVLYPTWYWWQKRRMMWEIIVVLLLFTPVVTTTFDYLVYHELYGLTEADSNVVGFSGIGSAFAGLLLASVGYYTKTRVNDEIGYNLMYSVFLVSAAILISLHQIPAIVEIVGYGLILLGLGVAIKISIESLELQFPTEAISRLADNYRDFALITIAVTVIFMAVFLMFPGQYGADDRATNVLAHFIGMAWGFLAAIVLIRYRTDRSLLPKLNLR